MKIYSIETLKKVCTEVSADLSIETYDAAKDKTTIIRKLVWYNKHKDLFYITNFLPEDRQVLTETELRTKTIIINAMEMGKLSLS